MRRTIPAWTCWNPCTGWLLGKIKLFCSSRLGREAAKDSSWKRSRNERRAVTLGKAKPKPRSKHGSPVRIWMSSGQSPPAVCRRTNVSRIWPSFKPRLRSLRGRLAAMRSGSLSARKAREVASRPACELAISSRGWGSISKGDLFWTGSRAGMSCYRPYIYNNGKQKDAPTLTFFEFSENYAWIRDLAGGLIAFADRLCSEHP